MSTTEIFKPNDFYGLASVLKEYAGLPQSYSLKAVVEHGVRFADDIWPDELHTPFHLFLTSSELGCETYRSKSRKRAIPIGFGILYAIHQFYRKYGKQSSGISRNGTVAFPSHSTSHITASFDADAYAKLLASLPPEFQPVYVCMYWKDYLEGRHLPYVQKGLRILSAGHMYDRLFLYRLYNICRQFKFSTSNSLGTHLFASIKSGCLFFYAGTDISISYDNHNNVFMEFTDLGERITQLSLTLFSCKPREMTKRQIDFVDYYIGSKHFKNKLILRLILAYGEAKYRFSILIHRLNRKIALLNAK